MQQLKRYRKWKLKAQKVSELEKIMLCFPEKYERKNTIENPPQIEPFYMFDISENPNVSLEFIVTHPQFVWCWDKLSANSRFTLKQIMKYNWLPWKWNDLLCNPNMTTKFALTYNSNRFMRIMDRLQTTPLINYFIEKYPQLIDNDYLWYNPFINIKTILKYPNILTNPNYLNLSSMNSLIELKEIEKHPELPWDWRNIAQRDDMTLDFYLSHPQLHSLTMHLNLQITETMALNPQFHFSVTHTTNSNFSRKFFEDHPNLFACYCGNPYTDIQTLIYWYKKTGHRPCNIAYKNPAFNIGELIRVSLEYDFKIYWYRASFNPTLTCEIVKRYNYLDKWDWTGISCNKFIFDNKFCKMEMERDIKRKKMYIKNQFDKSYHLQDLNELVAEYCNY